MMICIGMKSAGHSFINSAYAALYGKWETRHAYLQGGLIGGYNFYKTNRDINFGANPAISRQATGSHQGMEGAGYLQLGAKVDSKLDLILTICFCRLFISS